jgi:beta-alanine--pyruvate transaminase
MNTITDAKHLEQTTELDMSNFWMPFTANKQFKAAPRMFKKAKGM